MMPYLCRLVVTLSKHFPDIGQMVIERVQRDFGSMRENHNMREDKTWYEKRERNMKYICELTKFRLLAPDYILNVFKTLIDDFSAQSLDLIIVLIEKCGRFLMIDIVTS